MFVAIPNKIEKTFLLFSNIGNMKPIFENNMEKIIHPSIIRWLATFWSDNNFLIMDPTLYACESSTYSFNPWWMTAWTHSSPEHRHRKTFFYRCRFRTQHDTCHARTTKRRGISVARSSWSARPQSRSLETIDRVVNGIAAISTSGAYESRLPRLHVLNASSLSDVACAVGFSQSFRADGLRKMLAVRCLNFDVSLSWNEVFGHEIWSCWSQSSRDVGACGCNFSFVSNLPFCGPRIETLWHEIEVCANVSDSN